MEDPEVCNLSLKLAAPVVTKSHGAKESRPAVMSK